MAAGVASESSARARIVGVKVPVHLQTFIDVIYGISDLNLFL